MIDSRVRFHVSDNGIESKYFERVFEMFCRFHGRSEYRGTGIGLAICERMVDRLGDEIWVESPNATGSTFYLTLKTLGTTEDDGPSIFQADCCSAGRGW